MNSKIFSRALKQYLPQKQPYCLQVYAFLWMEMCVNLYLGSIFLSRMKASFILSFSKISISEVTHFFHPQWNKVKTYSDSAY